jgi:hypothetical protein
MHHNTHFLVTDHISGLRRETSSAWSTGHGGEIYPAQTVDRAPSRLMTTLAAARAALRVTARRFAPVAQRP